MSDPRSDALETGRVLRLAALRGSGGRRFRFEPDAEQRQQIARDLDLTRLDAPRLEGEVVPAGAGGWDLTARLSAKVEQPCVVTLAPVRTRIDAELIRRYRPDLAEPEPGTEIEMPEDDALEPMPAALDLAALLQEELSLAIPAFPRASNVEADTPGAQVFTEPGKAALTDEDLKPFAALKALRDRGDGPG